MNIDEWKNSKHTDHYFYHEGPPFDDFNRELFPPGTHDEIAGGVVGIRVDDDFWVVAQLPWEFHTTPLPEIVACLWPEVKNATFNPDTGPGATP